MKKGIFKKSLLQKGFLAQNRAQKGKRAIHGRPENQAFPGGLRPNLSLSGWPVDYLKPESVTFWSPCKFGKGGAEIWFQPANIWHYLVKIFPKYHGLCKSFVQNLIAWTSIKL